MSIRSQISPHRLHEHLSGLSLWKHAQAVLILLGILASWAWQTIPAEAQPAAIATDIRLNATADTVRLVLETNSEIEAEVFALRGPYRIVVDLPEVGWQLPAKPLPQAQGLFRTIRFGLFEPGTSRVVMELSHPVEVTDAFLLPGKTGAGSRLVVDLRRTSEARFAGLMSLPKRFVSGLRGAAPPATVPRSTFSAPPQTVLAPPPTAAPLPGRATQFPAGSAQKVARHSLPHPLPPRRPSRGSPRYLPMIVIDPGHGGADPGTIGASGAYEKHLVLAIGKELRRQLKRTGRYRVAMTRDRDVFIRLRDRVGFARDKKADLFISIHADSIENRRLRGASVYTLSEKASDKEAQALADKENKADLIAGIDLSGETPEVTDILIDLAQRETMNSSAIFASKLIKGLEPKVKILSRAHRFAGFAVLKAPDVPSVLIETGFLSNPEDERKLKDKTYRTRLASGIIAAIDTYFQRAEQATRP